jgi:hypothetical protein
MADVPVSAQPGDLAVWYAASPDQQYVAYGWITGFPSKREPTRQPYGPVAGVRLRPGGPVSRAAIAAKAHGFQETNVDRLAVTVPVLATGPLPVVSRRCSAGPSWLSRTLL